ncbi:MAG: class I SAM-dependent methyltransferase [Planctomycetaceae bacterium]
MTTEAARQNITTLYTEGSYLEQHPEWHAERSPWKAGHVVRGIREAGLTPATLCDIGCGTGLALAEVTRGLNGIRRAVGFDPSPDVPLHPKAKDVIEFRRENAASCSETFDIAIMLDVFEHVEDYFGFLRDCRHLAQHHIFHIPLDANARTVVGSGCDRPRRTLGHLHYFSRLTALATLRDTGYEPIHWHFTKSGWDGPGANRSPWKPINILRRVCYQVSPEYTHRVLGGLSLLVVARAT